VGFRGEEDEVKEVRGRRRKKRASLGYPARL